MHEGKAKGSDFPLDWNQKGCKGPQTWNLPSPNGGFTTAYNNKKAMPGSVDIQKQDSEKNFYNVPKVFKILWSKDITSLQN